MNTQERAKQTFEKAVENHEMSILLDEGLYRHVRFRNPDDLAYWFDLVTWPGYLAINGDLVSGFTFQRIEDMFQFFASDKPGYINPQYWSEKITCPLIDVREFDHQAYEPSIHDHPPYDWNFSYLMSCHAISWGVARYREEKG